MASPCGKERGYNGIWYDTSNVCMLKKEHASDGLDGNRRRWIQPTGRLQVHDCFSQIPVTSLDHDIHSLVRINLFMYYLIRTIDTLRSSNRNQPRPYRNSFKRFKPEFSTTGSKGLDDSRYIITDKTESGYARVLLHYSSKGGLSIGCHTVCFLVVRKRSIRRG
jgi:hypothetical protein